MTGSVKGAGIDFGILCTQAQSPILVPSTFYRASTSTTGTQTTGQNSSAEAEYADVHPGGQLRPVGVKEPAQQMQ